MKPLPLLVLYTLSGLAGLAWQVLWVRAWTPVLGAGLEAVSAVTATFLAGLGIGGLLAGRLRGTPLKAYAALEAGVGLWGAALPAVLAALSIPMATMMARFGAAPVRLLSALLLIGPPAVALGATYPLIARALHADAHPHRAGLAYGLNALGAACGALLAGMWLPWALGLQRSSLVLGGVNLTVAALALLLSRRVVAPAPLPEASGRVDPILWWLAGLSGLTGLALEVTWSRLSGPLLVARGGDSAAFAAVLAAVLVGIGLGGLLGSFAGRRAGRALAVLQALLAVCVLLILEPVRDMVLGDMHYEVYEGLLPLLPALFLGATFPLLSNELLAAGRGGLGRLYAVNTLGAVIGALAAGFLLVPALGAQRLAVLLAGIAALTAGIGLYRDRSRLLLPWVLLAAAGVTVAGIVTPPVAGARLLPPDEVLVDALEGRQASTLVARRPDGEHVLLSGGHRITQAGRGRINDHELRALGPASLHGEPKRVLSIGLGTGETARAFLTLEDLEELVVVELDARQPEMLAWFGNDHILSDPRLTLITNDGRWFLRTDPRRWDVISVDAYGPRTASATFYTTEFYAQAVEKLQPGGLLFVKFNPASLPDTATISAYIGALFDAAPDAALVSMGRGFFGLVGGTAAGLDLPENLIVSDPRSAAPLLKGVRRVTDDHPVAVPNQVIRSPQKIEPFIRARREP
ncbi:MAG: hypothetical protein P8R54_02845 [Myxococcota bacterium]|nr:hypothetical protein [Myxococcota bacterium]